MNWPRVKWLLIAMLLLGNLLLLGLYLTRRAEVRTQADRFRSALLTVLSERGVSLSPEVKTQLFNDTRRLYAPRDTGREEALTSALLGQVARSDLGGRIYEYAGASGGARFWGAGQFELNWIEPRAARGTVEDDGPSLLSAAGFPADPPPVVERSPGATAVKLSQFADGLPVFNAFAHLQYHGEAAVSLSGQWLWGDPLPAGGEAPGPVLGATLLRFTDRQREEGTPVSFITDAQPGYILSTYSPDYLCLIPAWRIKADGHEFYISADTGERLAIDG